MSARKPKAAPIDRSALPPVVHVSGLVVNGSNRFRLAFGRDDPVQRCVPSRPKRKGGKRDATQHNKTPFESETNKAIRARENGVRGICRGTVICRLGCALFATRVVWSTLANLPPSVSCWATRGSAFGLKSALGVRRASLAVSVFLSTFSRPRHPLVFLSYHGSASP